MQSIRPDSFHRIGGTEVDREGRIGDEAGYLAMDYQEYRGHSGRYVAPAEILRGFQTVPGKMLVKNTMTATRGVVQAVCCVILTFCGIPVETSRTLLAYEWADADLSKKPRRDVVAIRVTRETQ